MSTVSSTVTKQPELHWVKPVLPTALDGHDFLPIPCSNYYFMGVDLTWLLPGPLDITRLKEALSLTLRDFPHCAGRLALDDNGKSWKLRLANEPVSIAVGKNDEIEVTDEFMAQPNPEISHSLPFRLLAAKEMASEPLLRFKVTEWTKTGETSISMSISHILNDGASLFHVMDTLSAYYLNQPPPLSPTFEHFFTTPPECPRSQLSDSLPHLLRIVMDYPPNQILQKFGLRMMSTERLVLRFTKDQLSKLKDRATRESGNKTWSSMDSLGGYLATLQNRFDEEPVREIHYILGYRGAKVAPESNYTAPPSTSQGNAVMTIQTRRIPANKETTLGTYTQLLRSSIRECLSPEILPNLIGLTEELYARAHEVERIFDNCMEPGSMGFNSLYRVPFHHAHFGYEGKARFFFGFAAPRYYRVYPANPVKHIEGDGTVKWESHEGDATIEFGVPKGSSERIVEMIKEDMLALDT